MLQNLLIILSGNSYFSSPIIPKIIPEICARYKHINYGIMYMTVYIRIMGSKLTALLEYLDLFNFFYACTVSVV